MSDLPPAKWWVNEVEGDTFIMAGDALAGEEVVCLFEAIDASPSDVALAANAVALLKAAMSLRRNVRSGDNNCVWVVARDIARLDAEIDKATRKEWCEYGNGADCNNLPEGVARSVCSPCKARAATTWAVDP